MPRMRQDLIAEVLLIVGVAQTGQQPSAEDAGEVDGKIDGVLARLSRRGILYVQNVEAIDDEYFRPLAIIVAGSCDSGTPPDAASVQYAESQLREMQQEPGANDPVQALYF